MDRQIIYAGQVPVETDLLKTNQGTMVALAKLSQAIFGTNSIATGFGTTQTVVPSLAVLVAGGELYSQQNLEATAYSSLPQDLTHSIVKQGIMLDPVTLTVTPPGTAGFSINYLLQVAYQDSDSGSAVLPYYNASNPSIAYSGPANSGAAQPTIRQGVAVASLKAGTAATTGTQTTPAPDSGKVGLYVITVANGASTVVNANISAYPSAPLLAMPVTNGRLIGIRQITSTQGYTPTPGTKSVLVELVGGGGSGGTAVATTASQTSAGAGGGGGGYARSYLTSGFSGVTVTIGAGGSPGGTSSFGALMSCTGGQAGSTPAAVSDTTLVFSGQGTGGVGSGGNLVNSAGGSGLFSIYGNTVLTGMGGPSFFGPGAPFRSGTSAGLPGVSPGSGGSGGGNLEGNPSNVAGGLGASGLCLIHEFA